MEKQSGGEFASTDTAAGAQDTALQELWLSVEIPVEPCSRLQYLAVQCDLTSAQTHRTLRAAAMKTWPGNEPATREGAPREG